MGRDLDGGRGHIAPLTCCQWHPSDRRIFMTGSEDYTVRSGGCACPSRAKALQAPNLGGAGHS